MSATTFYLYRETPLHSWEVVGQYEVVSGNTAGEFLALPDAHWYSQAIEERNRKNGRGEGQQEALSL